MRDLGLRYCTQRLACESRCKCCYKAILVSHDSLILQILFTRTRILSVKVLTLQTFQQMVSTLDKATLTTKLVPLLAKIKTREPAVMMATLGVHSAMGAKVDREAIATLVLPQLWAMSMGPLLNQEQFGQFMAVIKDLGGRVEREHSEHLRDVRRLESSQAVRAAESNGLGEGWEGAMGNGGGEVDFETLVKGGASSTAQEPSNGDPWDDGWGDATDNLVCYCLQLSDHEVELISTVTIFQFGLNDSYRSCSSAIIGSHISTTIPDLFPAFESGSSHSTSIILRKSP